MIYRITLKSNPRILIIAAIIPLGPVLGIASFNFVHPIIALLSCAAAGFVSWSLYKFMKQTLESRIETSEEGIAFDTPQGDHMYFRWDEIDLAGRYEVAKNKRYVYIYKEEGDRLLTIPDEYAGFDHLGDALGEHLEVEDIELAPTQTIADYLRARLCTEEDDKE